MIPYNVIRSNAAQSLSNDFLTIIGGASRSNLLTEVDAEGAGTTSAFQEFGLYRVATAGATGGGAITPVVAGPAPNLTGTTPALAWSGTCFTTWATQPVLGALIKNVPLNLNGQRYFWRCNPNLNNAISIPGGNNAAASLSVRGITGTGNMSLRLQLLEL
jgi:hypothetical protein